MFGDGARRNALFSERKYPKPRHIAKCCIYSLLYLVHAITHRQHAAPAIDYQRTGNATGGIITRLPCHPACPRHKAVSRAAHLPKPIPLPL